MTDVKMHSVIFRII